MSSTSRRALLRGTAAIGVLALTLAACSSGGDEPSADASQTAEGGGSLTVWAWDPTVETIADAYEQANPGTSIEVVNAGTGNDQYTALQNAIVAGAGVPDLAQIEYYAIPQFSIAGSLANISGLGAGDLESVYTPGPWDAVEDGGAVYGLPLDSGPMALFYNATLFEQHGVPVPATWEQYLEAARALKAADPSISITNDAGDAGLTTSLIWQAGGRPFSVDGTTVGVDFSDEGTQRFATLWQTLLGEDLIAPIGSWSDEWYSGLGNGTIATLVFGAWMGGNLASGVPDGVGDWRVAPMPQWNEGEHVSAEHGGSAMSVMEASQDKELAFSFLQFASAGGGVPLRIEGGGFPATTAELGSVDFLTVPNDYFGDQQINTVLAEAAAAVPSGWQYIPFQVYANSIFNDTVGQAFVTDTTVSEGLTAWQDALVTYGEDQGFTMR